MQVKQKIQKTLYQNYREFMEFINDQCIPSSISFILIYLPSITIFGDLLQHVDQGQFWHNAASLSFSNVIVNFILNVNWLLIIVKVVIIFSLMLPLFLALIILGWSAALMNKDEELAIGYFYKKYNRSMVCRIARVYIRSFQKITFPILISLGIKLQLSQTIAKSPVSGILVMGAGLLNSFIFHYYNLQIPSAKEPNSPDKQINFPNVAVENILIMSTIIAVNCTSGVVPFVVCLALFLLRTITNNVLRYQSGHRFYQTQFSLFCGSAISLAFFMGYFTNQYTVMAVCGCIGVILLSQAKTKGPPNINQYQQVENCLEEKQMTMEEIKELVGRQKITKAFKEAVLISRRKISHRDQLTIDILKSKCFALQCNSRSSVKTVNSQQLLTYQIRIVKILKKLLIIQEKSIETLKLIKNKEPKQEMFIKKVVELATLIDKNKEQFIKCLKINSLATQITVLMELFFKQLYNDSIFLREITGAMREQTYAQSHKLIQKQLFSKDTALVVINVLDEVGKISKVSNNMQNVLGYNSHSLIGLSINQLIPITIRQVHDNILTTFIDRFSSEITRNKPSVEFYAYNKMFHLQKVEVRYKFFLQFFHNFQLSGVIKQLKTEDYVIILDEYGNIEGWTAQIGELFNFDQISGTDCHAYNIMPMLPSYAKYESDVALCFRTIFFRLSKTKNQKLMLFDSRKNIPTIDQIRKKQIEVFMNLLKQGEIIEGYLVNVQSQILRIKSCNKMMRVLKIIDIKRVQNFQRLQTAILGSNDINNSGFIQVNGFDLNHMHQDKSFEESYDADFSIAHTSNRIQIHTDLNFTLDFKNPNVIDASQLKFSKDLDRFQSVFSSRSLLKIDIQDEKQQIALTNQNITIQSTFDPKLQRKNSFIWTIILVAIIQISILIESQVSLSAIFTQFQIDKNQIRKGNRAEMIYCKTVFNPNKTYIGQFNEGNLLVYGSWLLQKNFTYISFDGNPIVQNMFYVLNVQIPSTLNRIFRLGNSDNKYKSQLEKNFYGIISAYEMLYVEFKQQWNEELDTFQTQSTYRLVAIAVGMIIYLVFLIFVYRRYKNQRKMTEAFFKFQRSDIDSKISNIKRISEVLQKRCQEWFIDQYLHEIKKNNNLKKQSTNQSPAQTHAEIKKQGQTGGFSQQDISQRKIGDQTLNQQEVQIVKRRLYFFVGLVVILLFTQIIFLILQGVLTKTTLESFSILMNKIDDASKLSVYPNLKMASLFYPVPENILSQYEKSVNDILNQPSDVMPSLFQLLKQKPCPNCTFLSEVLSTNYRSFYSYFMQIMQTATSKTNLTDIYYAVDVVSENVIKNLNTKNIADHSLIILLYAFSLAILFYGVIAVLRDLQSECQKLECFLKFFDGQSLTKNKHMSTIMAKNM